jgi:hypothetical protein
MAATLPEYQTFQPKDTPDDATSWIEWMEGFEALVNAMNIPDDREARHNQPARTQRYAMLWHYIGKDTRRILKKLDENGIEDMNYVKAKDALAKYFTPDTNRIYQMHILNEIKQQEGESMDNFYTRVKEKADLVQLQALTRNKIIELVVLSCLVQNTNNVGAKRKALKTPDMDIKGFLTYARAAELADHHMTNMSEQASETVSYVRRRGSYNDKHRDEHKSINDENRRSQKSSTYRPTKEQNCGYCGKKCDQGKCPAFGKRCAACNRWNHFASVCRQKQHLNQVEEEQAEDSDESIESIYVVKDPMKKHFFSNIDIETREGRKTMKFQVDTGASCNTMSHEQYKQLTNEQPMASNTLTTI